jgi:hypothetical protein
MLKRLRRFLPPYRMIRPKTRAYATITTIEGKRTPHAPKPPDDA